MSLLHKKGTLKRNVKVSRNISLRPDVPIILYSEEFDGVVSVALDLPHFQGIRFNVPIDAISFDDVPITLNPSGE